MSDPNEPQGGHGLAQAWRDFVAAYEGNDDQRAQIALREWIHRWDDAFWARDFSDFPAIYHPDVEIVNRIVMGLERRQSSGVEGFKEMRNIAGGALAIFRVDIEEFHRASGDRVVGIGTLRARGRASGIALKRRVGIVWTLRDGKISRAEGHSSAARALRAAGLEQSVG